jgi:hypothetical protein
MLGSLDDLPLTIGIDRRAAIIGLAAGLLGMIASWYFSWQHSYGFFLACLVAFMCGMLLLTSPLMTISTEGLAWGNWLGRSSWPWSDFDLFEVRQIPVLGITCVRCQFSATHAGGPEGIIGLLWEIPTPHLVAILNEARQRWARMPLAGHTAIE